MTDPVTLSSIGRSHYFSRRRIYLLIIVRKNRRLSEMSLDLGEGELDGAIDELARLGYMFAGIAETAAAR